MNSHFNNTTTPLEAGKSWIGGNEIAHQHPLICVSINCSNYCLLTIKQTNDLIHYDQVDTYNISPNGRYIQEFSKCAYFHVEVLNVGSVAQTYLSVATTFTTQNQLQDTITVNNTLANPLNVAGTVAIAPNQYINIVNAGSQYNSGILNITAGVFTSSSVSINNHNLVDVFLSFGSAVGMADTYVLQVSPDNGTTWFNNATFTLSDMPVKSSLQVNTSATQVRVQGTASTANTIQVWITAKST